MDKHIVLMGVSGCGKSTIGKLLSDKMGIVFYDGDDYHPPENIEKMRNGYPLNDTDRVKWLEQLNNILRSKSEVILACSALKPSYRAQLAEGVENITFIYLKATYELILARMKERTSHFFSGEKMLKSQFETLVEPNADEAIQININKTMEQVVDEILYQLSS